MHIKLDRLWPFGKSLLRIVVGVYVGFGLLLVFFQKNFVYVPDDHDFHSCPELAESTPLDLSGTRVYYQKKSAQKVAVLYHGNAGSACDRAFWKEYLEPLGFSYIIVEYTGYSHDTVGPSKELILRDAEHVAAFIEQEGFADVTIAGESLGTAVAAFHSTLAPTHALLLISPFYSLNHSAEELYWMYPVALFSTETFDSATWIQSTQAKNIEMIHGISDDLIPIADAKMLFAVTPGTGKQWKEIAGAHHNDIYDFAETKRAIMEFLSK